MKRSLCTLAVGVFLGSVMTLAVVLWLQRGIHHAVAEGDGRGAAAPSGNGDVNGDGTIDLSDGVYILNWLFSGGPAPVPIECTPAGVSTSLATGQTKCYDNLGNVIACDRADFPGQDGFYQAGCPVEGRFADNGDGTVTDNCTGLMWQAATAPGSYTWQEALAYCAGLTLAGHSDWRLPNVREFQSLVDYSRFGPTIPSVFGAVSDWDWTSTSDVAVPGDAWGVGFGGNGVYGHGDKANSHDVRAVRGGL